MSISSDPFFSEVDLGSRHEERLRLALLDDAEFQEEEYAIMLTVPLLDGAHSQEWILPRPHVTRMAGNRIYSCLLAGLMFSFFVGSAALDSRVQRLILRRTHWPIVIADIREIPVLSEICRQLCNARAFRIMRS
ncbi:MAG: hypothetical protein ACKVYV_09605 [Limisphaerales bacterium]